MERQHDRSVTAGRESDDRPASPRADRAEMGVHIAHDVAGDRGLPVSARPPVQVLGIRVVVAGALGRDDDRAATARCQRAGQEVGASERARYSGQPVQEVDDGIALPASRIVGRKIDDKAQASGHGGRVDRALDLQQPFAASSCVARHDKCTECEGHEAEGKCTHRIDGTDLRCCLTSP